MAKHARFCRKLPFISFLRTFMDNPVPHHHQDQNCFPGGDAQPNTTGEVHSLWFSDDNSVNARNLNWRFRLSGHSEEVIHCDSGRSQCSFQVASAQLKGALTGEERNQLWEELIAEVLPRVRKMAQAQEEQAKLQQQQSESD